jgi:hypothetical protein
MQEIQVYLERGVLKGRVGSQATRVHPAPRAAQETPEKEGYPVQREGVASQDSPENQERLELRDHKDLVACQVPREGLVKRVR